MLSFHGKNHLRSFKYTNCRLGFGINALVFATHTYKFITVLAGIERPRDWGFDSARRLLPAYTWTKIDGFDDAEVEAFDRFLRSNVPLIFDLVEHAHGDRAVTCGLWQRITSEILELFHT